MLNVENALERYETARRETADAAVTVTRYVEIHYQHLLRADPDLRHAMGLFVEARDTMMTNFWDWSELRENERVEQVAAERRSHLHVVDSDV